MNSALNSLKVALDIVPGHRKNMSKGPSLWANWLIGLSFLKTVTGLLSVETGIVEGKAFTQNGSIFSSSPKERVELVDSLLSRSELDRILNPIFVNKMADFHVAGAAISIVKDGKTVYTRGYGKAEVFEGVPVMPEKTISHMFVRQTVYEKLP